MANLRHDGGEDYSHYYCCSECGSDGGHLPTCSHAASVPPEPPTVSEEDLLLSLISISLDQGVHFQRHGRLSEALIKERAEVSKTITERFAALRDREREALDAHSRSVAVAAVGMPLARTGPRGEHAAIPAAGEPASEWR